MPSGRRTCLFVCFCVLVHIFKWINVEWDQSKTHTNHLSCDLHRMTINQRMAVSLPLSLSRCMVSCIFSDFFSLLNRPSTSTRSSSSFSRTLFHCHYTEKCLKMLLFAVLSVFLFILCSIFRNIIHPHHFTTIAFANNDNKLTTHNPFIHSRTHISADKVFNSMRIWCQVEYVHNEKREMWGRRLKVREKSNPKRISSIHVLISDSRIHREYLVVVAHFFSAEKFHTNCHLLCTQPSHLAKIDDFYLKSCLRSIPCFFLSLSIATLRIRN